jgi:S1-C subfamily serine protease
VVDDVRPSVVAVIAYSDLPAGEEAREGNGLELKKSVGSGVVINDQGHVITAMRVVGDSRNLFIRTSDGEERPAVFLGADQRTDLVLLKTRPEGLKPAPGRPASSCPERGRSSSPRASASSRAMRSVPSRPRPPPRPPPTKRGRRRCSR